jgi:hypothetical protein
MLCSVCSVWLCPLCPGLGRAAGCGLRAQSSSGLRDKRQCLTDSQRLGVKVELGQTLAVTKTTWRPLPPSRLLLSFNLVQLAIHHGRIHSPPVVIAAPFLASTSFLLEDLAQRSQLALRFVFFFLTSPDSPIQGCRCKQNQFWVRVAAPPALAESLSSLSSPLLEDTVTLSPSSREASSSSFPPSSSSISTSFPRATVSCGHCLRNSPRLKARGHSKDLLSTPIYRVYPPRP